MFHIKLRQLRKGSNLTREELANKLNISYSTMSKYETNQRQPDLDTLKSIAAYFNVSIDYLLNTPYSTEAMMNDVSIYFEAIKSIVKDNEDVYFKQIILSDKSKNFLSDSVEYISNQINNIESDKN